MFTDYKPKVEYIRPSYPMTFGANALKPVTASCCDKKPCRAVKRVNEPVVIAIDVFSWFTVALAAVLLIMMLVGWNNLQAARAERQEMLDYIECLEEESIKLEYEFYSQIDMEYVERCAQALGMVPIEDVQHITINISTPSAGE